MDAARSVRVNPLIFKAYELALADIGDAGSRDGSEIRLHLVERRLRA